MKNLISMTDFILEQKTLKIMRLVKLQRIEKYAHFLQQPLELWMFVPCDNDGNILEEKSIFNTTDEDYIFDSESFNKYQQAKERCLIEGFTYDGVKYIDYKNYCIRISVLPNLTFQDLTKYNLKLTPAALIQFT
jgi:hypothetical protein